MTPDVLTVSSALTTLDLLLWRKYRREVPGLVEQTLAQNRGLAALGPILPIGTKVTVTPPAPPPARTPRPVIRLFG